MISFTVEDKNPDESQRSTYRFVSGVVGFFCADKLVEEWQQGRGWVHVAQYTGHSAVTIPSEVKRRAIEKFESLGGTR